MLYIFINKFRCKCNKENIYQDYIASLPPVNIIIHIGFYPFCFILFFLCKILMNNEVEYVVALVRLFMFMSHYVYCCFKTVYVSVCGMCMVLYKLNVFFISLEKPKSSNEIPKKLCARELCQKAITHALKFCQ